MSLSAPLDPRDPLAQGETDLPSILQLARQLIRIRSRPGDSYTPVLSVLARWLTRRGLHPEIITDAAGAPVAVASDVHGAHPGPRIVLDTPIDTAPFGDETAWSYPPTSATIRDGWLYGRGAADSKVAAAIFAHLAVRIAADRAHLHGTLTILADADEHAGGFAGARSFIAQAQPKPDAVMIGYPGFRHVVIGCRGFWRATIVVAGTAGHTGGGKVDPTEVNAAEKAAELVGMLARHRIPASASNGFGLPPKLTVTAVHAGEGYSIVPDRCELNVDARLTPTFDRTAAERLVTGLVDEVDRAVPGPRSSVVSALESWPAYQLSPDQQPAAALLSATARYVDPAPAPKIAGPSNIGNYLAGLGIPATAGFGVDYVAGHGTDERIDIGTIPQVFAAYHDAVRALLNACRVQPEVNNGGDT